MPFFDHKYESRRYWWWSRLMLFIGRIRISPYPMFISYVITDGGATYGDTYHRIKETIQPGDILLVKRYGKLNNLFLPTFYVHSGIYIGDSEENGKERIVHSMTPNGVQLTDLISYIETHELAIVRPGIDKEKIDKAIKKSLELCGNKFDYNFTLKNKEKDGKKDRRYYCAELVADVFAEYIEELGWTPTPKTSWYFRKTGFTPDDFLPGENSKTKLIFRNRIRVE